MWRYPRQLPNFCRTTRRPGLAGVLEGLVIGACTARGISRGRAFELLGLNHWTGEAFFRQRGIVLSYDAEEFKQDIGA